VSSLTGKPYVSELGTDHDAAITITTSTSAITVLPRAVKRCFGTISLSGNTNGRSIRIFGYNANSVRIPLEGNGT
jgi:hypothetical protein